MVRWHDKACLNAAADLIAALSVPFPVLGAELDSILFARATLVAWRTIGVTLRNALIVEVTGSRRAASISYPAEFAIG